MSHVQHPSVQELLFTEDGAHSLAWNTGFEDMLAFAGQQYVYIKTANFPLFRQKHSGLVVGFEGSCVFSLGVEMSTVDVPQSASMLQYLDRRDFDTAYKVRVGIMCDLACVPLLRKLKLTG